MKKIFAFFLVTFLIFIRAGSIHAQDKQKLPVKLAIFPWYLTGSAEQMNFIAIDALKDALRETRIFIPKLSYYDLGDSDFEIEKLKKHIFKPIGMRELWVKKWIFVYPNEETVCTIANRLGVDAVLMLSMNVGSEDPPNAEYEAFIIDTATGGMIARKKRVMNFEDNGPSGVKKNFIRAFREYKSAYVTQPAISQPGKKTKVTSGTKAIKKISEKKDPAWEQVAKKIERLGELLSQGLISQEEYDHKKDQLLEDF